MTMNRMQAGLLPGLGAWKENKKLFNATQVFAKICLVFAVTIVIIGSFMDLGSALVTACGVSIALYFVLHLCNQLEARDRRDYNAQLLEDRRNERR
jgi:hypothetical protein